MDEDQETTVFKMIQDLQSGTEAYRRSGSNRLSLNVGPSRLSYSNSNVSTPEDNRLHGSTPLKRPRIDEEKEENGSILGKSTMDEIPCSPWEWRRLRAEVVSLRTTLAQKEVSEQKWQEARQKTEEALKNEKAQLKTEVLQCRQEKQQLEYRLNVARQTIEDERSKNVEIQRELTAVKADTMDKMIALANENAELKEKLNTARDEAVVSPKSDINEEAINVYRDELERAQEKILELEEERGQLRNLEQDLELQIVENRDLKMKLERMESEQALAEEGKRLVARAAQAAELEKELSRAKETIAHLRESVKGKLILEQQVYDIKKRLEHTERLEQQVATLEAEKMDLTNRVTDYEKIGSGGASSLKRELIRLSQSEVVLMEENGQLQSKMDAVQRELSTIAKHYEESKRLVTETATANDKMNKFVSRLQKKILLISRERDSYRQQLDLYEKEITCTDINKSIVERIPALERAIEGYRDLVKKLEADLAAADGTGQCDERKKLREEVERLKGEIEHRALKGDFNCDAKVVHFTMNPMAIAERQAEEKHEALIKEVEELRLLLKSGANGGQPSTIGSSLHAQEIAELKQSYELKNTRLKEVFKASSQEFRQACYQMFGWRIDRNKDGRYKIYSQYAESPDDYLCFQNSEDGMQLLENEYSTTLVQLIEEYLQRQNSVPMFLNALQADLYSQQTSMI